MPPSEHTVPMPRPPSPGARLRAVALVLLMAAGSVFMWIGVPVGWLYLASQMASSSRPELGPYLLVIAGVPVTMVVIARGLRALDRAYARTLGTTADERRQLPWMRSMRDARTVHKRTTVLDLVMVVSVGLALLAAAIWFFFFAGSSLPGA